MEHRRASTATDLAELVRADPDLQAEVRKDPVETLERLASPLEHDLWIYRIVVNQARNRQRWWRRRHRSAQVSLDDHVKAHGELPSHGNFAAPDRVFGRKELASRLKNALLGLPFDQRTTIVLREIDGLSYEEIAYSQGVAVGTVKSRLARARDVLRSELREPELPEPNPGRADVEAVEQ